MKTCEKLRGIYEALGNIINDLGEIVSAKEEKLCCYQEGSEKYIKTEELLTALDDASQDISQAHEVLESIMEVYNARRI
jgi:hypothetical protein